MMESEPVTMSEIIKIYRLIGKHVIDIENYNEAYNAITLFEKRYGNTTTFSPASKKYKKYLKQRTDYLWWFVGFCNL